MNTRNTPLLTLCLTLTALIGSQALAGDLSTERGRVLMLLGAYDNFPTVDQFKGVAVDPESHLLDIYHDPKINHGLRLQALDALSLMPSPASKQLFIEVLGTCHIPEPARDCHRAINGLMHGWGEEALGEVVSLLHHEDVQVRLTAVQAIGTSGGELGREAVLSLLSGEKHPVVRERAEKITARLR